MINDPLIEIRNLQVEYWQQNKWATVVHDLSLMVYPGEAFGMVGESGCGKSTTANALLGYRPGGCRYVKGKVDFCGRDMLSLPRSVRRKIVGREISLVPQNPATALSPGMRVGQQIIETLHVHGLFKEPKAAHKRALDLMELVRLKDIQRLFDAYPNNLSGGQQQRVLIAIALACEPRIVVLDEPTTGLDVTTQDQILDLLLRLRSELNMAMFYITHNLGVVATIADRIGVMYAGSLVEIAECEDLFNRPVHPYSQGLIASVPRIVETTQQKAQVLQGMLRRDELPDGCPFAPRCPYSAARCFEEPQILTALEAGRWVACWRAIEIQDATLSSQVVVETNNKPEPWDDNSKPLLEIRDLRAGYIAQSGLLGLRGRQPKLTVSEINLEIYPGETLALVGESGSGKTTIARAVSGTLPFVDGTLLYHGHIDLRQRARRRPKDVLRSIQYIFQNPDASLNPRQRIEEIVGRPLKHFYGMTGSPRYEKVKDLLADVRLPENYAHRFPDELSGGERQRVALARALAADPDLILCDEILSALDVSVQANILDLLVNLQMKRKLAYLFISHDLAVVHTIAHRVAVIYRGKLCEIGGTHDVFQPQFHPYTRHLLEAVPEPDPGLSRRPARAPLVLEQEERITACPYATYCPLVIDGICQTQASPWLSITNTHHIRCHADVKSLKAPQVRFQSLSTLGVDGISTPALVSSVS